MIEVKQGPVCINPAFYKITDEEYFAREELSNSDISKFLESPKAYKYYKAHGGMSQTTSMLIGSMVHCLYLEPELFEEQFIVAPKIDKRTKAGKAKWINFKAEHASKKVVDQETWDEAYKVFDGLNTTLGPINKVAGFGHAELSGFFRLDDVKCRMKIDYLTDDGYIWDLKTTKSLKAFGQSIANYGYHRQVAMYYLGVKEILGHCRGFKFIVVENNQPYDAAIFKLDAQGFQTGVREIKWALRRMKTCIERDRWPGAFQHEEEVGLPRWYRGIS